ncbi:FAD-dependent oxidoreductase [Vibrio sp. M60_M31a]
MQAFNMMAAINPKVKATMIDGALFQDEVKQRDIMAVPSVFVNGELFGQGRMSLTEILNKVDDSASEKAAKALDEKEPYDVLVVGGGSWWVVQQRFTQHVKASALELWLNVLVVRVMDTMAIENFVSVKRTEGPKLAADLGEHLKEYDVDVVTEQQAKKLMGAAHTEDGLIHIQLESGATLKSQSVILSPGARWREMNVPGEQEYRNKGVAYCPHCDGPLFKGKKTAVIGGGNSGIEAAIDLAGIVEHVTVLEFADVLRADQVLINKANSLPNVDIITMAQTTEVVGDGKRVTGLKYKDRNTDEIKELELSGIFVQIGLVPNTEWLKDLRCELVSTR